MRGQDRPLHRVFVLSEKRSGPCGEIRVRKRGTISNRCLSCRCCQIAPYRWTGAILGHCKLPHHFVAFPTPSSIFNGHAPSLKSSQPTVLNTFPAFSHQMSECQRAAGELETKSSINEDPPGPNSMTLWPLPLPPLGRVPPGTKSSSTFHLPTSIFASRCISGAGTKVYPNGPSPKTSQTVSPLVLQKWWTYAWSEYVATGWNSLKRVFVKVPER